MTGERVAIELRLSPEDLDGHTNAHRVKDIWPNNNKRKFYGLFSFLFLYLKGKERRFESVCWS